MLRFNLTGGTAEQRGDLLVALVEILSKKGLRVSVALAAANGFEPDKPGKDSYEHRRAGAMEVALASELRWAIMAETAKRAAAGPNPLDRLEEVDLLLLSGFEETGLASLQILEEADGTPPRKAKGLTSLKGISEGGARREDGTIFDLDDKETIADFILSQGKF